MLVPDDGLIGWRSIEFAGKVIKDAIIWRPDSCRTAEGNLETRLAYHVLTTLAKSSLSTLSIFRITTLSRLRMQLDFTLPQIATALGVRCEEDERY